MNYKQKYQQYQEEVDRQMGHGLGKWGKVKAAFGSFGDARKAAIDRVVRANNDTDALYNPDHVIGVTGSGPTATVYYRRPSGTFGHITTQHDIKANEGREPMRKNSAYTFGNTSPDGTLEEKIGKKVIHTSRNALVPKANIHDVATQQRIQTAHTDFTNVKDHKAIKREVAEKYGKK